MLLKYSMLIIASLIPVKLYCQDTLMLELGSTEYVCNFDGAIGATIIPTYAFDESSSTQLIYQKIRHSDKIIEDSGFTLKCTDKIENAIAVPDKKGKRYIIVNPTYFLNKLTNKNHFDAAIALIVGHEIYHHVLGHLFDYYNDVQVDNLVKELMADKMAGGLLAKMNIASMDVIDSLVNDLFGKDYATTHPSREMRRALILGGWYEEKLSASKNDKLVINNKVIKHVVYESVGAEFYGEISKNKKTKRNERYGFGTYRYSDYDSYYGNWENNVANGYGIRMYKDNLELHGAITEGVWEDGLFKNGSLYKPNGDKCVGNFLIDTVGLQLMWNLDGFGKVFYRDKKIYFGFLKKGIPNGEGILFDKENIIEYGNWEKGKIVNELTTNNLLNSSMKDYIILYPNNEVYIGNHEGKTREGYGLYINNNQEINYGIWKDDVLMSSKVN